MPSGGGTPTTAMSGIGLNPDESGSSTTATSAGGGPNVGSASITTRGKHLATSYSRRLNKIIIMVKPIRIMGVIYNFFTFQYPVVQELRIQIWYRYIRNILPNQILL